MLVIGTVLTALCVLAHAIFTVLGIIIPSLQKRKLKDTEVVEIILDFLLERDSAFRSRWYKATCEGNIGFQ